MVPDLSGMQSLLLQLKYAACRNKKKLLRCMLRAWGQSFHFILHRMQLYLRPMHSRAWANYFGPTTSHAICSAQCGLSSYVAPEVFYVACGRLLPRGRAGALVARGCARGWPGCRITIPLTGCQIAHPYIYI